MARQRVLRVLSDTRVFVYIREGGVCKKVREYARKEDDQGTHNLRFTPWMTIVVVFYATIKNVLDSSTGSPEAKLVHERLGVFFHPLTRLTHPFFFFFFFFFLADEIHGRVNDKRCK